MIVGVASNSLNAIGVPIYWSSPEASSPTQLPLLAGYTQALAGGINNAGKIVGFATNSLNSFGVPIYWSSPNVHFTLLPLLAGYTKARANGINNAGEIVGYATDNSGNTVPIYWSSPEASSPTQLPILAGYTKAQANGINNVGEIVGVASDNSDNAVPIYWSSPKASPTPLTLLAGYSYAGALGINDINTAISNICFPAGTPIKTDQGIINIEQIDTQIHTINRQPIRHITQTTTLDKYLISFEKNCLNRNVPNKKTIMTKDHKIEFEGKMVPAERFLNFSSDVKKVKYNGEILYNVLLENYSKININNIMCETLHPDNIIARLYTTNYTDDERYKLIFDLNDSLKQCDFINYKTIVNKLSK